MISKRDVCFQNLEEWCWSILLSACDGFSAPLAVTHTPKSWWIHPQILSPLFSFPPFKFCPYWLTEPVSYRHQAFPGVLLQTSDSLWWEPQKRRFSADVSSMKVIFVQVPLNVSTVKHNSRGCQTSPKAFPSQKRVLWLAFLIIIRAFRILLGPPDLDSTLSTAVSLWRHGAIFSWPPALWVTIISIFTVLLRWTVTAGCWAKVGAGWLLGSFARLGLFWWGLEWSHDPNRLINVWYLGSNLLGFLAFSRVHLPPLPHNQNKTNTPVF